MDDGKTRSWCCFGDAKMLILMQIESQEMNRTGGFGFFVDDFNVLWLTRKRKTEIKKKWF